MDETSESLVIPRDGWYKIGLQITYGQSDTSVNLEHRITKYSCSYGWKPITVLSVFETKKEGWSKSVFSELAHVFNKDDKVKVESDNALFIDSEGDTWTKTFLTVQFMFGIQDL